MKNKMFANTEECKKYFENLKTGYIVNIKKNEDVYFLAKIIDTNEQGIRFNICEFDYQNCDVIDLKIEHTLSYEELSKMEIVE